MKTMLRWPMVMVLCCCGAAMPTHAQSQTTGATPSTAVATTPTPTLRPRPTYILRQGDVVTTNYRYTPDFNQTVAIQPDGYVQLAIVGAQKIAGLTLEQARDQILKAAESQLNAPELVLSLKEFVAPVVTVAGEVGKPAVLPYHEGMTVLQAILTTGGFTENAREDQVLLFRRLNNEDAEVFTLKLSKLNNKKGLEQDRPLQPGDMILAPRDRISQISRYIKLANIGFYLNPLQNIP